MFRSYSSRILIAAFITTVLFSCSDDPVINGVDDPTVNEVIALENQQLSQAVPTNTVTAYVTGRVVDESNQPIAGVFVENGYANVVTDEEGYFNMGEVIVNANYALVKAIKPGYLEGFRTFSPTTNAVNTVSIQLLSKDNPATITAEIGGVITLDDDIQLSFPPRALLDGNGEFYIGQVHVYGSYINPDDEDMGSIMPGMLAGLDDEGSISGLLSYGMLTVELEDNSGNVLAIDGAQRVEVTLPAPVNAPATIPLWHFNETYGLWVEAGIATLVNDRYLAEVNHFSTWNLDIKFDGVEVDVTVNDIEGQPIANTDVDVLSEQGFTLASVFTDDIGQFRLINAPDLLTFEVKMPCDTISLPDIDVSSGSVTLNIVPATNDLRIYTLSGVLTDCDEEGNTLVYDNLYFSMRSLAPNEAVSLACITDANGHYKISTLLCNVSASTDYTLKAEVSIENAIAKDTVFDINFTGDDQSININYCGTSADTISDDFVIVFEDANLEAAIRQTIDLIDAPITYGDVKEIDVLRAYYTNTVSLDGIRYLTNLTELRINNNLISDISELRGLTNLTDLHLHSNQISDISALSGLVSLTYLQLSVNQISDISALSGLINLTSLSIGANLISDISSLSGLTSLVTLGLPTNQINDISALSGLTSLNTLHLPVNQISDISALSGITSITTLFLYDNQISDISALSGAANLTDLRLQSNQINSISALSGTTSLTDLRLQSNQINDVSALSGITSLKNLWLSENQISDVSALSGLVNSRNLYLIGNQIDDVASLCNLGDDYNGIIWLFNNPLTTTDIDELRICLPNANISF